MELGALMVLIFLGLIGSVMLIAVFRKAFAKKGTLKALFGVFGFVLVAYALIGIGSQANLYTLPAGVGGIFLSTTVAGGGVGGIQCPAGTTLQNGVCVSTSGGGATYQPTASYSAKDKYSTTSISGTPYYKVNGNSATTTAYTNTNVGDGITYWVSNTTYWVNPITKIAQAGVTPVEALGWNNGSATVTLYDSVNRQTTTDGKYNTSMPANGQANIEISYQGTAKHSAGPFGGLLVVETNSTMASITCTGDVLSSSNPYHVTYSVNNTDDSYQTWAYGPTLDDGSGNVKRIDCQFKNGATAPGLGSYYLVYFIPANYYVTNAGDIVLDTEKQADSDTTRTGSVINLPRASAMWGA